MLVGWYFLILPNTGPSMTFCPSKSSVKKTIETYLILLCSVPKTFELLFLFNRESHLVLCFFNSSHKSLVRYCVTATSLKHPLKECLKDFICIILVLLHWALSFCRLFFLLDQIWFSHGQLAKHLRIYIALATFLNLCWTWLCRNNTHIQLIRLLCHVCRFNSYNIAAWESSRRFVAFSLSKMKLWN